MSSSSSSSKLSNKRNILVPLSVNGCTLSRCTAAGLATGNWQPRAGWKDLRSIKAPYADLVIIKSQHLLVAGFSWGKVFTFVLAWPPPVNKSGSINSSVNETDLIFHALNITIRWQLGAEINFTRPQAAEDWSTERKSFTFLFCSQSPLFLYLYVNLFAGLVILVLLHWLYGRNMLQRIFIRFLVI